MRETSILVVVALALPAVAAAQSSSRTSSAADETLARIERDMGLVPEFIRHFPREAMSGGWDAKMAMSGDQGAIPSKYQELIGLGVAAQVPCHYCIYYHTESARASGATDREINEAVALASQTRRWSTILNGNRIEFPTFRKETDAMLAFMQGDEQAMKKGHGSTMTKGETDPTLRDIEATLGRIPSMLADYPASGRAGVWQEMKALELGETAIPGKYKQLIELAVAAQIPCQYCTYFHDGAARMNGATDEEIQTAIAISGEVRHWSTFLNGASIDENRFRQDIAAMHAIAKERGHATAATGQ